MCVCLLLLYFVGRRGGDACIVMCDGQGLDDDDARVIAENLNKFKRLKRLSLVSSGREGRGGREGRLLA